MNKFKEGLQILEAKFGNYKDNVIAIATISKTPNHEGKPIPVVREVDAYYEDGVFYVSTWAKSNKVLQIQNNEEVAFTVNFEWFNGSAIGTYLGWSMDPKNLALREKIKKAFSWYDEVMNDSDPNTCFIAIKIKEATLNLDHWTELYHMNFVDKTCRYVDNRKPE